MNRYKVGQKLWLNHSVEQMARFHGFTTLTYKFIILDRSGSGYKIGDGEGYSIWEPTDYVENSEHYLTKPTLAHLLYG